MSRDPPRNKKPKMDSGVKESEDGDDELSLSSESSTVSIHQFLQSVAQKVRELSRETEEPSQLDTDPTRNESAGLPSSLSDLAEDRDFSESVSYWFHKKAPDGDSAETAPPDQQVTTSMEPPESRSDLEQIFLDIFSQHIPGTTTDNSLLEELRRLLPSVARTHVNALIGHMLDWIELQRGDEVHNVQVLAPMEPDLNRKVQSETTVHSDGVRVKRGPYDCHWCGKLKKNCGCKLADDGSGEFEDSKKRKYTFQPIENVEENIKSSIKSSIKRGLEYLRTLPREDKSDSGKSKKRRNYLCNLCRYPKLPKEKHENLCVLRPDEYVKMGEDGKTVFKVKKISPETGVNERAREEASDGGDEKDGGSTKNQSNPSEEEEDDRKPAAKPRKQQSDNNEDDDPMDEDKDGGDRDDRSDKDSDGGTGFNGITRYAV